jgi:ATPase subunit of ABC transporter with duplicated ATPase domains
MLFSGDDATKLTKVLSGGERVRCMLARMMLTDANVLVLDGPTNHLDLESITSLNQSLTEFSGSLFLHTHDHQLLQTTANRIIELTPRGIIDRLMTFDEYLNDDRVKAMRAELYKD